MTAKQIIKTLTADGWYIKNQTGSHVQLKHPDKPGKVTVPVHGKKDLDPNTVSSIYKQAGMK